MKLSNEALIEIISIVQDGILGIKDASQGLRELDFSANYQTELVLSDEYISSHPRASEMDDDGTEDLN